VSSLNILGEAWNLGAGGLADGASELCVFLGLDKFFESLLDGGVVHIDASREVFSCVGFAELAVLVKDGDRDVGWKFGRTDDVAPLDEDAFGFVAAGGVALGRRRERAGRADKVAGEDGFGAIGRRRWDSELGPAARGGVVLSGGRRRNPVGWSGRGDLLGPIWKSPSLTAQA
jgi:hypothetical protein